jgi:hypothetical protein
MMETIVIYAVIIGIFLAGYIAGREFSRITSKFSKNKVTPIQRKDIISDEAFKGIDDFRQGLIDVQNGFEKLKESYMIVVKEIENNIPVVKNGRDSGNYETELKK